MPRAHRRRTSRGGTGTPKTRSRSTPPSAKLRAVAGCVAATKAGSTSSGDAHVGVREVDVRAAPPRRPAAGSARPWSVRSSCVPAHVRHLDPRAGEDSRRVAEPASTPSPSRPRGRSPVSLPRSKKQLEPQADAQERHGRARMEVEDGAPPCPALAQVRRGVAECSRRPGARRRHRRTRMACGVVAHRDAGPADLRESPLDRAQVALVVVDDDDPSTPAARPSEAPLGGRHALDARVALARPRASARASRLERGLDDVVGVLASKLSRR